MKYIYKICGKVSIVCYVFMLYQLWHLCQYGGIRNHIPKLLLGCAVFVVAFLIWWVAKRKNSKETVDNDSKKKMFYIELLIVVSATLYFGARIIYAAIPYNGALSWKLDEWRRKKEIKLEHNQLFESGVEGILLDLDKALELPEELYIANEYQMTFDSNGTVQTIYTFLYGKDEKGEGNTYLIDYDADVSSDMTVWINGYANQEYEEDMRLLPMLEILSRTDWISQVKQWTDTFGEEQIYEILYYGKRGFSSAEGLQYVSGDADGDGVDTGIEDFSQIRNGGEILGFEVSLHIPAMNSVIPVRYIMEPEYISQSELNQENTMQQIEEAQDTEIWTVDSNNGTMYVFLDNLNGWRLVITGAAAGSRFYVLEQTVDGGTTWERIHEDPFDGNLGVAEGLLFFNENVGVAGLTGASQSWSTLYRTQDGGRTFQKIELPLSDAIELPDSAEEYGFTMEDYDYLNMPQKEDDVWTITLTTDAWENDGIVFQSTDEGITWEYKGVSS